MQGQALWWVYFWQQSGEAIRCAAALGDASWHEAMISFMKSGGYSNLASKIMQIDKPTLILWESDQTLGIGDDVKFQSDRSVSTHLAQNCGHVPQLEQPQTTAASACFPLP